MTDNLFSKISYHKSNLQKHQANIAYRNLGFESATKLEQVLSHETQIPDGKVSKYKYFKSIQLEDILVLRATFDATNENHRYWCDKIHRFLEFRLNNIAQRLKVNYVEKKARVEFIQNVITLLLEYYINTNDSRYLSTVMKLLRNKSLATYGFLNNTYSAQYSYNILTVHNLINNL